MLTEEHINKYETFLGIDSFDPNFLIQNSNLDPLHDFVGFNFDGLYLPKINLKGFNLTDATFRNVVLKGANFEGSNLSNAIFQNTNLRRCNFNDADLTNTKFEQVSLHKTLGLKVDSCSIGSAIGKVLFIEDEVETIEENLELLIDTFPGIDVEIAINEEKARQLLNQKKYIFIIIDARIPESENEDSETLRGVIISEELSKGELYKKNRMIPHIILTHHKNALFNTEIDKAGNCLGHIEKGRDLLRYEAIVIHSVFSNFINSGSVQKTVSG